MFTRTYPLQTLLHQQRRLPKSQVSWCIWNHLHFNKNKTKPTLYKVPSQTCSRMRRQHFEKDYIYFQRNVQKFKLQRIHCYVHLLINKKLVVHHDIWDALQPCHLLTSTICRKVRIIRRSQVGSVSQSQSSLFVLIGHCVKSQKSKIQSSFFDPMKTVPGVKYLVLKYIQVCIK